MTFKKISKGGIALALSNLVPLAGVLLGYWSAFDIIFLYWFENIIIGLFAVFRMTVRPDNSAVFAVGGIFTAGFFCLHYGFFTYGHGVVVASFFEEQLLAESATVSGDLVDIIGLMLSSRGVQITILAMLIAHAIDYIFAYKERAIDAIPAEMFKTYKRIIVLHISIIFGGFIAMTFENSIGVAIVMIALKTYFDLKLPKLHKKHEEKKLLSDQKIKEKIDALLEKPEIKINGKTHKFDSVEDMVNSEIYQKYSKLMRWLMPKSKRLIYEQALQEAINKERLVRAQQDNTQLNQNTSL